MHKFAKATLIIVLLLIFAAIIPASVVSDPPVKTMDPPDGNVHYINTTTRTIVLDGVVNLGPTWLASDYIGDMLIRNQASPVAKAYATVEVNTAGDYLYLWIGIQMESPNYIQRGDGVWLRIDWDRDGKLDYEDHTNWSDSDGVDTSSGAEWMIPWGKMRKNPGDNASIMDPTLVMRCLDILLHVEAYYPSGHDSGLFPGERPHGYFESTTLCIWQQQGPPPGPGGWGLRTIGFWKHQLRTALGANGHQHVPTANLTAYLNNISSHTTVPELMNLDLRGALMVLELKGKHPMYDRAVQQLLATWLNLQGDGDQMVDTDGNGLVDKLLSDAIDYAESIITDSTSTHDQLEGVKDMLDTINNSGSS